jgi:hypothetical protein
MMKIGLTSLISFLSMIRIRSQLFSHLHQIKSSLVIRFVDNMLECVIEIM